MGSRLPPTSLDRPHWSGWTSWPTRNSPHRRSPRLYIAHKERRLHAEIGAMGGRKGALRALLVLLAAVAAAPPALATDYTVGDAQGWTTTVDYDTWASGKTFMVGDTLVFQYSSLHSVDEVGKSDYDGCSSSNAIQTSTSGNTKVPLAAVGNRYFICGTPGHCASGMKLSVAVAAASSSSPTTPSSPSTTPPSTPSSKSPPTASTPPKTGTGSGAAGALRAGGALVVTGLLVLGLGLVG